MRKQHIEGICGETRKWVMKQKYLETIVGEEDGGVTEVGSHSGEVRKQKAGSEGRKEVLMKSRCDEGDLPSEQLDMTAHLHIKK